MTLQQRLNLLRCASDAILPVLLLLYVIWTILSGEGIGFASYMLLLVGMLLCLLIGLPLAKHFLKCPRCGAPELVRDDGGSGRMVVESKALDVCHKCGQSFVD